MASTPTANAVTNDSKAIVELFAISDNGKVRSHNEDSVLVAPGLGLAVLADGMGGYNAGEVASSMATSLIGVGLDKALADRPPGERVAAGGYWRTKRSSRKSGVPTRQSTKRRKASPVCRHGHDAGDGAVFWRYHDRGAFGRLALVRQRGDDFRQMTRDHSLLQEQLDSGMISASEARQSANRNLVTRALGVDPDVVPEVCDYGIEVGDIYLFARMDSMTWSTMRNWRRLYSCYRRICRSVRRN